MEGTKENGLTSHLPADSGKSGGSQRFPGGGDASVVGRAEGKGWGCLVWVTWARREL